MILKNTVGKVRGYAVVLMSALLMLLWALPAYAQQPGVRDPCDHGLCPPTSASTIPELLRALVDVILLIGIPLAALAIIYAGFLFVTARGSEEKVTQARETFMWTVVGTALLLGAWVIITVLSDTFTSIDPGR